MGREGEGKRERKKEKGGREGEGGRERGVKAKGRGVRGCVVCGDLDHLEERERERGRGRKK